MPTLPPQTSQGLPGPLGPFPTKEPPCPACPFGAGPTTCCCQCSAVSPPWPRQHVLPKVHTCPSTVPGFCANKALSLATACWAWPKDALTWSCSRGRGWLPTAQQSRPSALLPSCGCPRSVLPPWFLSKEYRLQTAAEFRGSLLSMATGECREKLPTFSLTASSQHSSSLLQTLTLP